MLGDATVNMFERSLLVFQLNTRSNACSFCSSRRVGMATRIPKGRLGRRPSTLPSFP